VVFVHRAVLCMVLRIMFAEHIIYTLALSLILLSFSDMPFKKIGVFIILVGTCVPDLDGVIDIVQNKLILSSMSMAEHTRAFHNIGCLLLYALVAGILLSRLFKIRFSTAAFLSGIGFAAHILEDMIVYNPSSEVLWPLSSTMYGLGIVPEGTRNLWFANSTVLGFGILLLIAALVITITVEGHLPKEVLD
jgi:hypothetical protein